MLALDPDGTVTTQNDEPPAPEADRSLTTSPYFSLEGLSSQGRPLQPPSGHSMRTPKSRGFFSRPLPSNSKMGLKPSLTKVWPSPSVLAPAT